MAWWTRKARGLVVVRTTLATRVQAERLAQRLVQGNLAACVHLQEISSVYRWKQRVTQETEVVVEARTTLQRRRDVELAMLEGHPYETPLVESWPVHGVPDKYAHWAASQTR